jgi:hypothetical protein
MMSRSAKLALAQVDVNFLSRWVEIVALVETVLKFCNNFGSAWQFYTTRWGNFIAFGPPTGESFGGTTLTSYSGLWSITTVYNLSSGDTVEHIFVMLDMPVTEMRSVQDLISQPGAESSNLSNNRTNPMTDYSATFKTIITDVKADVFTTLATGISIVAHASSLLIQTMSDGYIYDYFGFVVVKGPNFQAVTGDRLRAFDQNVASTYVLDSVDGPEQYTYTPQPGVLGTGMSELVAAINAITDQDMEISFNNGRYTFSIKAKVQTGP